MPKHGKKYNKAMDGLDRQAKYSVEDAVTKA
ncbi:50S ribosomal protein L1, partial [Desulfovibrio sp. OttesenSCG-928-O18]|nr:50S ribosomal protein L1 [Desulfovibrio sp. OttesenSCG-928-O18]